MKQEQDKSVSRKVSQFGNIFLRCFCPVLVSISHTLYHKCTVFVSFNYVTFVTHLTERDGLKVT